MRNFLNLLKKSNISEKEIKRIERIVNYLNENSILYPDPDPIEVFDKNQKLLCKLTLREIFFVKWKRFKSINDYILWNNNYLTHLKKNRLSVEELMVDHEESIKLMEHQNRIMFHLHAIKKQPIY